MKALFFFMCFKKYIFFLSKQPEAIYYVIKLSHLSHLVLILFNILFTIEATSNFLHISFCSVSLLIEKNCPNPGFITSLEINNTLKEVRVM